MKKTIILLLTLFFVFTNLRADPYCGKGLFPTEKTPSTFYDQVSYSSDKNVKFLDSLMKQIDPSLTSQDHLLIHQIQKFPPYVIKVMPSKYLCDVLKKGEVYAVGDNTPIIEKHLYSAGQCVFFSVGAPTGQSRWRDVTMRFKPEDLPKTWAAPHSGQYYAIAYHFGSQFPKVNLRIRSKVTQPERIFFTNFMYTEEQWEKVLIDNFILRFKALSQQAQDEIANKLLSINNRYDFQEEMMKISFRYNLAYYMEAHVNRHLTLNAANTIEISRKTKEELVKNCPVAYDRELPVSMFS